MSRIGWNSQSQRGHSFWDRHATFVLLVLPGVTTVTTLGLTIWQGTKTIFLSDALNYYKFEPWPYWMLRYALWQSTFAGVFMFKRQQFGEKLKWLAYLNVTACMAGQYSGFSQITPATQNWQYPVHVISATCLAAIFAWETILLWSTSRQACCFGCIMAGWSGFFPLQRLKIIPDTGIPLVGRNIATPLQWAMLAFHLYFLWANYKRIQAQGFPPTKCFGRLVTEPPQEQLSLQFPIQAQDRRVI